MESDTQNNTETHENEQNPPEDCIVDGLSRVQAYAVVLKTEGKTYNKISLILGISVNTIKDWFRRGTPTYGAYLRYSKEVIGQIGTDSWHRLRLQTGKAVNTMIDLMDEKQPPMIRLRASAYILDRDLPLTLKEKEERADFFSRFEKILEVMEITPNRLSEKSEEGDKAREKFNRYMELLDNMENWV